MLDVQSSNTGDAEDEDIHPIDMSFPKGHIGKIILYILRIPLLVLLYLTLPDVGNKEYTIFPSFNVPGIYIKIKFSILQFNNPTNDAYV